MNLLPFGNLPPYEPRHFVPANANLGDPALLTNLFDQLEARAAACQTAADLERWLLDWSELASALHEEGARRNIAMTCHTDEPEAKRAFLEFVETIEPLLKPRE